MEEKTSSIKRKIFKNAKLKEELSTIQKEATANGSSKAQLIDKMLPVLQQAGFELDAEQIEEIMKQCSVGQLSDDELDGVSGGLCENEPPCTDDRHY